MTKPDHLKPMHQRKTFEVEGVTFRRLTPFHEEGKYSAVDAEGGKWTVTGNGTNRYPWFIHDEKGKVRDGAKNLDDAGRRIAHLRRRNPISPYKPDTLTRGSQP